MKFIIKKSDISDIPFYAMLLRNKKWLSEGGFSRPDWFETDDDLVNYIRHIHLLDMKCVFKLINSEETIAFGHFSKDQEGNIEYYGGVRYDLINKGYGVYLAIYFINHYYNCHNIKTIRASIIETNTRSWRFHEAIGFQCIGEKFIKNNRYILYELNKEKFYIMPIVKRLLHKSEYANPN